MTLVELLVVVTVILVLMAVSLPLIRPAIQEGYLREASRQVNVYISIAKARAVQHGRLAGLSIERTGPGTDSTLDISIVEEPLPYTGDFVDARIFLFDGNSDGRADVARFDSANAVKSASFLKLVSPGDRIKFDNKGPSYTITNITSVNNLVSDVFFRPPVSLCNPGTDKAWGRFNVDDDGDGIIDNASEALWPNSDDFGPFPPGFPLLPSGAFPPPPSGFVPYQVIRRPARTSVKPLQLAGGACLDLRWSGTGSLGTQFAAGNVQVGAIYYYDKQPVMILFDPAGNVASVYHGVFNQTTKLFDLRELPVDGPVQLLVGRFDQVPPPLPASPTAERSNLVDPSSIWVGIMDRSGALTVAENDANRAVANGVAGARSFVTAGQSMGGR